VAGCVTGCVTRAVRVASGERESISYRSKALSTVDKVIYKLPRDRSRLEPIDLISIESTIYSS
jgi:hypothetical protein